MISLAELKATMPSPVEMDFQDGVWVIAVIIDIAEDVDEDQICYTPLKVLRAPRDSIVRVGEYITVSASYVVSWHIYTGPRDWETPAEGDSAALP